MQLERAGGPAAYEFRLPRASTGREAWTSATVHLSQVKPLVNSSPPLAAGDLISSLRIARAARTLLYVDNLHQSDAPLIPLQLASAVNDRGFAYLSWVQTEIVPHLPTSSLRHPSTGSVNLWLMK